MEPSTPPAMKPVFTLRMPIRWGDMDAMGHVNNTVYFRYLEQTRIEWFASLGHAGKDANGQGPVIVNASMNFRRQLHYPGEIECRLFAGQAGRSSFETWMEIRRTDDPQTLFADGGAKVVWCDYAAGRSVPLPAALRSVLEG